MKAQETFIWTEEAITYLAGHMMTKGIATMARALGTRVEEVRAQLSAMGFDKGGKQITTEHILMAAQAFKARRGYYPRTAGGGTPSGWHLDDYELARELGVPNQSTVARRFGNLSRAWAAAEGVPVELANVRAKKVSDETLLDLLNVYKHVAGHYPEYTSNRLYGHTSGYHWTDSGLAKRLALPNPCRYRSRFGDMSSAQRQALARPVNLDLVAAFKLDDDEVAALAVRQHAIHCRLRADAREKAREVERQQVLAQLNTYYAVHGGYPLEQATAGRTAWKFEAQALAAGLPRPHRVQYLFGSLLAARTQAAGLADYEVRIESYTRTTYGKTHTVHRKKSHPLRKPAPAPVATEVVLDLGSARGPKWTPINLVELLVAYHRAYGHYPLTGAQNSWKDEARAANIGLPRPHYFARLLGSMVEARAQADKARPRALRAS